VSQASQVHWVLVGYQVFRALLDLKEIAVYPAYQDRRARHAFQVHEAIEVYQVSLDFQVRKENREALLHVDHPANVDHQVFRARQVFQEFQAKMACRASRVLKENGLLVKQVSRELSASRVYQAHRVYLAFRVNEACQASTDFLVHRANEV